MSDVRSLSKAPKGLSFSIADLVLITAWSVAQSLDMIVQLDYGTEGEEYEEVLAFHNGQNASCLWIMWRDAEMVWVQPIIGRAHCHATVTDAIASCDLKHVFSPTVSARDTGNP
jgi:hypothetical protein